MTISFVFLDHTLGFNCRNKNFPADKQLNTGHLVGGVKHFPLHDSRNIVENMVSCVVHEHAYDGERDNFLSVLLHALVNGCALVKFFEPIAWHPFKLLLTPLLFLFAILPSLRVFSA